MNGSEWKGTKQSRAGCSVQYGCEEGACVLLGQLINFAVERRKLVVSSESVTFHVSFDGRPRGVESCSGHSVSGGELTCSSECHEYMVVGEVDDGPPAVVCSRWNEWI